MLALTHLTWDGIQGATNYLTGTKGPSGFGSGELHPLRPTPLLMLSRSLLYLMSPLLMYLRD